MLIIYISNYFTVFWASQLMLVLKNLPDNPEEVRDVGSIPGLRRSPGGGHGNPFQYSCLENPVDRGAWRATAPRLAKSWTRLKWLSMHTHLNSVMLKKLTGSKKNLITCTFKMSVKILNVAQCIFLLIVFCRRCLLLLPLRVFIIWLYQ